MEIGNRVWPIEWHEYQWLRASLKITSDATCDKMRRAVPMHLQSFLLPVWHDASIVHLSVSLLDAGIVSKRLHSLRTGYPWLSCATLCFREISMSPKIKVLFSGTLSRLWTQKLSPRYTNRRRVRYKQRQQSACCWQHLATKADVAHVVNSRRRLPTGDRTEHAALRSIGCEASSRGSPQYELIYFCGWRRILVFAHNDG